MSVRSSDRFPGPTIDSNGQAAVQKKYIIICLIQFKLLTQYDFDFWMPTIIIGPNSSAHSGGGTYGHLSESGFYSLSQ